MEFCLSETMEPGSVAGSSIACGTLADSVAEFLVLRYLSKQAVQLSQTIHREISLCSLRSSCKSSGVWYETWRVGPQMAQIIANKAQGECCPGLFRDHPFYPRWIEVRSLCSLCVLLGNDFPSMFQTGRV